MGARRLRHARRQRARLRPQPVPERQGLGVPLLQRPEQPEARAAHQLQQVLRVVEGRRGFFIGGADESGNAGRWKETDEPIPLGRWTHLAATREGSTLRLYVDGALAKTFENYTTLSPWSSDYPHDLTLGGVDGGYAYASGLFQRKNISRSFAGAMREARVWNVARTDEEIAKNYDRRSTTPVSRPAACGRARKEL